MASNIGNLVVNLSANIAQFHSDMKKAAAVTQESVGKIERSVQAASRAFGALVGVGVGYAISQEFKSAINEIDRFRVGTIAAASTMTDMLSKTKGTDIGATYAASLEHAKDMYNKLDLEAAKHFASGKELQMGYNMFLQKGVMLREQDISALGVVVDKIKLMTQGQSSNLQIMQEIRSLNDGQARAGSALASLLKDELGKGWADIVEQHRQAGDLLQWMASLFPGLDAAVKDIENTLEAQKETLTSMLAMVGREGLGLAYDDIVGLVKDINEFLRVQKDDLVAGLKVGWSAVKEFMSGIVTVVQAITSAIMGAWRATEGLRAALNAAAQARADLGVGMAMDLYPGVERSVSADEFAGYETAGEGLRKPWGKLPTGIIRPAGGGGRRGGGRGGKGKDEYIDAEQAIREAMKAGQEAHRAFMDAWHADQRYKKLRGTMGQGAWEYFTKEKKWTARDFERIEGGIEKGPKKIWTPTGEDVSKIKKVFSDVAEIFGKGILGVMTGDAEAFADMGIAIAKSLGSQFLEFVTSTIGNAILSIFEKIGIDWIEIFKQGANFILEAGKSLVYAIASIFEGIGGGGGFFGSIIGGIASFLGFHHGGLIPRAHSGLYLGGGGEIPIMAQAGEFVLSRRAVQRIGVNNLMAMNQGGTPAGGGNIINIYPRYPMSRTETEYMVRTKLIPAMKKHQMRYGGAYG